MGINCNRCGQATFRPSRFRFRLSDLSHLALMQMPVRCVSCAKRRHTSLFQYRELVSARKARRASSQDAK